MYPHILLLLTLTTLLVTSQTVCNKDTYTCPDGSTVSRDPSNSCNFEPCPIACDMDAKVCEDGTSVGRDPNNNCEFKACPEEIACTDDVKECSDGSYVSRNSRNNCEFDPCPDEVVACTEDAKQCDDGSFVSRDPKNNCEFDPCPDEVVACTEDAKQCDDGSFVSRDPNNNCEFDPCPDEVVACTMDAKLCDDGSYVGRDSTNNCEFKPCPDALFCTQEAKVCPDGSYVGRNPDRNCEFDPCGEKDVSVEFKVDLCSADIIEIVEIVKETCLFEKSSGKRQQEISAAEECKTKCEESADNDVCVSECGGYECVNGSVNFRESTVYTTSEIVTCAKEVLSNPDYVSRYGVDTRSDVHVDVIDEDSVALFAVSLLSLIALLF